MKKIICLLVVFSLSFTVFAADFNTVSEISVLAYGLNMDFENINVGKSPDEGKIFRGEMTAGVLTENNNRYLRLMQPVNGESVYEITVPKTQSGVFLVQFNFRINGSTYKQIPTLKGSRESDGAMTELIRNTYTATYSVNDNNSMSLQGNPSSDWHKLTMQIDCKSDKVFTIVDEKASGWLAMLDKASDFSIIRFLLRGENEYIDLDNIKVFKGYIDGIPAPGGIKTGDNAEFKLPERHPKIKRRFTAYENTDTVKIDGKLDEEDWKGPFEYLSKQLMGSLKSDVNFAVMHDDKGIYVGVIATDAVLNSETPAQPWLQDGIEVYIDGGNEKASLYDENDRQYSIGLDTNAIYNANQKTANMCEGVSFAQSKTENGWTLEMYIPYSAFSDKMYSAGDVFGFDVGYNDCFTESGIRDGQSMWSGTSSNSKSAIGFGELELSEGKRKNLTEADKFLNSVTVVKINSSKSIAKGLVKTIDYDNNDVTPVIKYDTAFVPVRFLVNELGADISYNDTTGEITIIKDSTVIKAIDGKSNIEINGQIKELSAAPFILNDRLLLPLRAFSNALQTEIAWHDSGLIVIGASRINEEIAENISKKF